MRVKICGHLRAQSIVRKRCFLIMNAEKHRYTKMRILAHIYERIKDEVVYIAWLKLNARKPVTGLHPDIANGFLQ